MAPKTEVNKKSEKLNIYTGPQGSAAEKTKIQSTEANAAMQPQTKTTAISKTKETKLAQIWDPSGTKVIKKIEKANIYTGPQGKSKTENAT
jgi:hypothetical protein